MRSSFSFPFSSSFGSGFSFAPGPGGSSLEALNPTAPSGVSSQLDQLIDPATRDYVRTANGEWAETADSRTMMFLMIEIEFGGSPFDPLDGTTIGELRRNGDPVTIDDLQAETVRVGGILRSAGIISDFEVVVRDSEGAPLRDEVGRQVVRTSWRDLASGSPVALILQSG